MPKPVHPFDKEDEAYIADANKTGGPAGMWMLIRSAHTSSEEFDSFDPETPEDRQAMVLLMEKETKYAIALIDYMKKHHDALIAHYTEELEDE